MDKLIENIKDIFVYGGISQQEYQQVRLDAREKNQHMLKAVSIIATLLMLILFVLSFFSGIIAVNSRLYGVILADSFVLCIIVNIFTKKRERIIDPLMYIFLILFYGFAIIMGTYLQPAIPATTFCVLLFAGPLLFIDKPYKMSFLLLGVTVSFCFCSVRFKEAKISGLDTINAVSFLVFSIFINACVTRVKMRELVHHRHIELERDTDELTKLLTKAAMERNIKAYIEQMQKGAALLVVDIDDFKSINDTYGHAYGDAVLRIMGQCLRQAFREEDKIGRFGGDEFVIFIPGIEDQQGVIQHVEHLVHLMKSRIVTPENVKYIHGSIGIAFYPKDASSYEELFEKADVALYESKKMGKACYTFYLGADEHAD